MDVCEELLALLEQGRQMEGDHREGRGEQGRGRAQASLRVLLLLRAMGSKESSLVGTLHRMCRREGNQDAHTTNMTQRVASDNLVTSSIRESATVHSCSFRTAERGGFLSFGRAM